MPPANMSLIMLETEITNLELSKLKEEINQFKEVLKQYPNIKYVVLKNLKYENKEFSFYVKKIYTTAKVIIPDIKIGIGINFIKKKET
jgi:carbamoylphosphate synthase large subunit